MICLIHFLFYFLIVALGDGNRVTNNCLPHERQALLHFKTSIEDPHDFLSTWRHGEDGCCKWIGVTCNHLTGHVTKLDLSIKVNYHTRLGGEISTSLLNLTYLTHLDLSYNSFHGKIPMFLPSMTRLRYLDLSVNSFSGTIPMHIGSMTELRYLNLLGNDLNGTIPKSIGSLSRLRYLDLDGNYFNGTIPKSIGLMIELRYLSIGTRNFFYGIFPSEFGNLTNLQELSLGRCRVENLDWLSHLSHLQTLDFYQISLAKVNYWVNVVLSLQKLSSLYLIDCDLSQVMYPYSTSFLNSSSSYSLHNINLGSNNLNSSMYSWFLPFTSNSLNAISLSFNMLDGIPKYLGNLCNLKSLYLINNSAFVNTPNFLKNLSSGCTSVTLQKLYVSSSQFTGSLSDEIQKFSSLKFLDLSYNDLNGTISEKLWEIPTLESLGVSFNSFGGVSGILENIQKSKLSYIDLSSCKLGPRFPKWIQSLKHVIYIGISNNRISDTVGGEFWKMWPSQLRYLNLSSNNLTGRVTNLQSNFDLHHPVIDLSSNNFYGPILKVPSTLRSLNLSRNKFNGGISFLCQIVAKSLYFLDLSHNSFTGRLPNCLWQFKELIVLNLGYNNLSGRLPASVGYLVQLEVLHLYNNSFSGELPLSLKNCTKLNFLNLGANRFVGNVPVWIGENLSRLYALSLRSNNFFGTIPGQLCRLVHLQILDLSMNNLFGTIPKCMNNLTLLVQEGFSQNTHFYYSSHFIYVDHAIIEWHGNEFEFTGNLRFLKSIDVSSNNLTGKIPKELIDLRELLALNLSKNSLVGEIPQNIGYMKKLLSLDLSRNKFSGDLPSSMSEMTSLDYLDVSYNNLSGRIPTSTQLQSFEPSRYTGNTRLCGPPITKYCPGDKESQLQLVMSEDEDEGKDELQRWFYIGMSIGFVIGFWVACSVLLLNSHRRHSFFYFLDSSKDWIYVKVMVFISKWKRFVHTS